MLAMDELKDYSSSSANTVINVKEFTQKKLKTNSFGREVPYFEFQ